MAGIFAMLLAPTLNAASANAQLTQECYKNGQLTGDTNCSGKSAYNSPQFQEKVKNPGPGGPSPHFPPGHQPHERQ